MPPSVPPSPSFDPEDVEAPRLDQAAQKNADDKWWAHLREFKALDERLGKGDDRDAWRLKTTDREKLDSYCRKLSEVCWRARPTLALAEQLYGT